MAMALPVTTIKRHSPHRAMVLTIANSLHRSGYSCVALNILHLAASVTFGIQPKSRGGESFFDNPQWM